MSGADREEKKQLLHAISKYGFTLDDIILFLDTHPQNQDALDYCRRAAAMYQTAKAEYENRFGPLTITSGQDNAIWQWAAQSWPWERGYC